MFNTWVGVIGAMSNDSTPLTASTTATSILHPSGRAFTNPIQWDQGTTIMIRAMGRVSTVVTTPGTLTFMLRAGPTSNISVFTSQALTLVTTATTNVSWWMEGLFTCRIGGSGTTANLMGSMRFDSEINAGGSAGVQVSKHLPASAPAVGTGFDSTSAMVIDLFAQWSISNANTITTHQYVIEQLN